MKRTVFVLMMMFVPVALAQELETTVEDPSPSMAHVSNSFSFTVDAPLRDAAPLFGPEGERAWAGEDWKPQFVFPTPPRDVEGSARTALRPEANAHVGAMGKNDSEQGKVWEDAVHGYLQRRAAGR
jgi:hypothetical protein